MARAFTQYWKNTTLDWHEADKLEHAASNQFRERGVRPGDRIFVVTVIDGNMHLGGVLVVDKLMGKRAAQKIYGKNVWDASDHVVARGSRPFYKDLVVPMNTVRALRFAGNKELVFKTPRLLDTQTLRGVRELTPGSAALLQDLVDAAESPHRADRGAETGSSAIATIRNSPVATREVFDQIFDSIASSDRRLWERFLAESIDFANSSFSDRWVVALHRGYLRFNVGMVLCIQFHREHGVTLLLEQESAPRGIETRGSQYKNAPGCDDALIPFAMARKEIDRIRAASRGAINICGSAHRGSGAFRAAHSPGVLRYLEQALGRTLPNPSYVISPGDEDGDNAVRAGGVEGSPFDSHPFADELALERDILGLPDLSVTEKEAIIMARRGQGVFKQRVACLEPRCRVTGIVDFEHLRASHIKPWKDSSNVERTSENNGLLLAPHVDHLFDRGFISFTDNGDLLVSQQCPKPVLAAWAISATTNVGPFRLGQRPFLAYHREHRFKG